MVLAEILGPDLLVILAIVALLFGSTRLPKLARSLGSAKSEFEKGIRESHAEDAAPPTSAVPSTSIVPPTSAVPPTSVVPPAPEAPAPSVEGQQPQV